MKMTIGRKLTISFLGLAMLVLLAGVVGIIVLNMSSSSADIVAREKAPTQYAVMNATLAVEKVQKLMIEFANTKEDFSDIERQISGHLNEFDMWTDMIKHGTNSDDFANSPSGQLYAAQGLKLYVPKGSEEIAVVIDNILEENRTFRKTVNDLILFHKNYSTYLVKTRKGDFFALPDFLNLGQKLHIEWLTQLKDAVNIETTFTGETDPQKGLLGNWLHSYQVDNEELMKLIKKTKKQFKKLRDIAVKINKKEDFKSKLRLFNRSLGATSKIEKYFLKMHKLAGTLHTEFDNNKSKKFSALKQSASSINKSLNELIEGADKEMGAALATLEAVAKRGKILLMILTVIAVVIAVVLGTIMSRYLAGRIQDIGDTTKKISEGDLRNHVSSTSQDELGTLASDTNSMIDNLRQIIGQVTESADNMANSSTGLADVSGSLDINAMDLSSKSSDAADATSQMSTSMTDISTAANDSMERVQSVALATEEMNSTISEIAQNAEKARAVTEKAVVTVDNTTSKMNELSEAANEIGKVAEVIVSIADQTNLLSLNATIEAARAGEAGKGFAVVANEVKELAGQTNAATEDIRHKINAIQQSSDMTIAEISEIANIINEINSIVVVIAGAVEEQAITTRQITEDINSVSGGIESMTQNVVSATDTTERVSGDIDTVNATSKNVQDGSALIKSSSEELEKLANELQKLVGQFHL